VSYVEEWALGHPWLSAVVIAPILLLWVVETILRLPRRGGNPLFQGRMYFGMRITPNDYQISMWLRSVRRRYGIKLVTPYDGSGE